MESLIYDGGESLTYGLGSCLRSLHCSWLYSSSCLVLFYCLRRLCQPIMPSFLLLLLQGKSESVIIFQIRLILLFSPLPLFFSLLQGIKGRKNERTKEWLVLNLLYPEVKAVSKGLLQGLQKERWKKRVQIRKDHTLMKVCILRMPSIIVRKSPSMARKVLESMSLERKWEVLLNFSFFFCKK